MCCCNYSQLIIFVYAAPLLQYCRTLPDTHVRITGTGGLHVERSLCDPNVAGAAAAACPCCLRLAMPGQALAANGATAVDDTDIDPVGNCKVDTWFSAASNSDRVGVVSPAACSTSGRPLGHHLRLRARAAETANGASGAAVKVRTFRIESGKVSALFSAAVAYDFTNSEVADVLVNIPVTFQILENFKINLNGGWLHNLPRRPALGHLGRELRLERQRAVLDHRRGVRARGRSRSGPPACPRSPRAARSALTSRTRTSTSTWPTAATSLARTPTGSRWD